MEAGAGSAISTGAGSCLIIGVQFGKQATWTTVSTVAAKDAIGNVFSALFTSDGALVIIKNAAKEFKGFHAIVFNKETMCHSGKVAVRGGVNISVSGKEMKGMKSVSLSQKTATDAAKKASAKSVFLINALVETGLRSLQHIPRKEETKRR